MMRFVCFLLLVAASSAVAVQQINTMPGIGALPGAATIGYVPLSAPFDNPLAQTAPVAEIPESPECTVRPQTIVEIKRMRRAAARIATMIQTEVIIMEKRKTYVEQMTSYLNDRIRELNKVKGELEQESRWIELSNQRISELANKEKLIKMQDVMACLASEQARLTGAKNVQGASFQALQAQTTALQTRMTAIKNKIKALSSGQPAGAAGAAGAPGAPAAPGAAPAPDPAAAAPPAPPAPAAL